MSRNAKEELAKIIEYRRERWSMLLSGKITDEEYANGNFHFLAQNKIRPYPKPHEKDIIIVNYYYWLIQMERRIATERSLFKMNLGSKETLDRLLENCERRRDQMVRRLLWELEIPIRSAHIVYKNTAEIEIDGYTLYASALALQKVKINIFKRRPSRLPKYMELIHFN